MLFETTVLLDGLDFPECPRWHAGKLWFSDMRARKVKTVSLDGSVECVVRELGSPAGLGWLPDGRLLVVMRPDQRLMRWDSGVLTEIADLRSLASASLNDMVVDTQGRAYIGNQGYAFADPEAMPRLAEIVLVDPEGGARVVAEGMAFPNGMAIAPDGRTLFVAESFAALLTAFDVALDGSLSGRRIWARFDDRGFEDLDWDRTGPDGICLDAEGAIWVASPSGSSEVLRVLEGGRITDQVRVETQPFASMLGGPDRRTLFVCTSIWGEGWRPGIGRIEFVEVDVPGTGLP